MGREIRKVPANWEHPKNEKGYYIPLHDKNYEEAINEWYESHNQWLAGTHEDQVRNPELVGKYKYFADWSGNPPCIEDHVQYNAEDCVWVQAYENVSEGTPVTPAFATIKELEDYLVNVGECVGTPYARKFSRESAHAFCQGGYAPSMVIIQGKGMFSGIDSCDK